MPGMPDNELKRDHKQTSPQTKYKSYKSTFVVKPGVWCVLCIWWKMFIIMHYVIYYCSERCDLLIKAPGMMTSWNGTIFLVTGHLCGEFTGPRLIPRTKASDAELWFFSLICVWINGWVNNHKAGDLRRYCAHYDVIVMFKKKGAIVYMFSWPKSPS